MAGQQPAPHVPVSTGGRVFAGGYRWLAPAHFAQRVAGVAFVLGIDPRDHPFRIGDDDGNGAVLQCRAQHGKALHALRQAAPVAQRVQRHGTHEREERERAPSHHPAQPHGHDGAHVVQQHQLPGARRVLPVHGAAAHGIAHAVDQRFAGVDGKRQGRHQPVVETAAKLARAAHRVDAFLRQGRGHRVEPLRTGGREHHALRRHQQHGMPRPREQAVEMGEPHLDGNHTDDGTGRGIALIQRRCVIEAALLRRAAQGGIYGRIALQGLLKIGPMSQRRTGRAVTGGVMRYHRAVARDHVGAIHHEAAADDAQARQHRRRIVGQKALRGSLERRLAQAKQGNHSQQRAVAALAQQRLLHAFQQLIAFVLALFRAHQRDRFHCQPGTQRRQHEHPYGAPQPPALGVAQRIAQNSQPFLALRLGRQACQGAERAATRRGSFSRKHPSAPCFGGRCKMRHRRVVRRDPVGARSMSKRNHFRHPA